MMLQGKTALITGATRGIGRGIAERLHQEGARVAVCGRDQKLLTTLAETYGWLVFAVDVADKTAVQAMIQDVVNAWNRLDIVVNNAGITRDGLLLRMRDEQWQDVIDVNLTAAYYVSQAALRPMSKQRSGRIINISSVVACTGSAGQTNYAAAKAGLIGFSKSLAREMAGRNILVNVVAPGYIDTDMTNVLSDVQKAKIRAQIPLGRTGTAEDVAAAVAFLASEDSRYITGQTIHVNGGLLL